MERARAGREGSSESPASGGRQYFATKRLREKSRLTNARADARFPLVKRLHLPGGSSIF
jgi:hypothetical protein